MMGSDNGDNVLVKSKCDSELGLVADIQLLQPPQQISPGPWSDGSILIFYLSSQSDSLLRSSPSYFPRASLLQSGPIRFLVISAAFGVS